MDAIHDTLFKPEYQTPIRALWQPLLVAPSGDKRPFYLAELFTIIEGGRGQDPETEELLQRDANRNAEELVDNGWALTSDITDVLSHLSTPSMHLPPPNQSLALVPSVYFYTNAGRPVRGLLYGLIYWLLAGDEASIRERKRIFSAYRGVFEQVFLDSKEAIVAGFSRNVGSGPEVTVPVARYFNRLLGLLVKHKGDIYAAEFQHEHDMLLSEITGKKTRPASSAATTHRGRSFSAKQKSISVLSSLLANAYRCEICGGILDPSGPVQHDHIQQASKGGATSTANQRITHPFCNQQRQPIELIQQGQQIPVLPLFVDPELDTRSKQLKLFSDDFLSPPI